MNDQKVVPSPEHAGLDRSIREHVPEIVEGTEWEL